MSSGTKKAKPSSSNKKQQRLDDSDTTDKKFTFKISKKRSPWTQEVKKIKTGRRSHNNPCKQIRHQ